MPQQLLITGATGFLGAYLSRALLQAGYRLRALRRPHSRMDLLAGFSDRIEWVEGDLLDVFSLTDSLRGVDAIVHAGALVSFDPADRERMLSVNGEGTANVVNAALAEGTPRLLHVSSVAALGRDTSRPLISEADRWQDKPGPTGYARSKFLAEREIWRGQAEGLSVAALYPSVILGAGRWQEGPPQLFSFVDRGLPFYPTGSGGFVDVRDVAEATLRVLQRQIDGDRFLLNAANLSYREVFGYIAGSIGKEPPGRPLRRWQTGLLWRAESLRSRLSGRRPLITRESSLLSRLHHRYDNLHSVQELGMQYRSIPATISETGQCYLQAGRGSEPRLLPMP